MAIDVLARVAHDMRVAQMPSGDRAYAHLKDTAKTGADLHLTDHELVLAVSRALWNHELATAQLGLSELEIRTADAVHQYDEREAA